MGPRAGLDRCGKSRPHRDSIPDRPSRSSVAIPTELPGSQPVSKLTKFRFHNCVTSSGRADCRLFSQSDYFPDELRGKLICGILGTTYGSSLSAATLSWSASIRDAGNSGRFVSTFTNGQSNVPSCCLPVPLTSVHVIGEVCSMARVSTTTNLSFTATGLLFHCGRDDENRIALEYNLR